MSMRQTWKTAKKTATARHAQAYEGWLKAQQIGASDGDPKARKALLVASLARSGLTKGFDATKPMSFDAGLGPVLDKIEGTHVAVAAAFDKLDLDDLLKKKGLNALWKAYAEKVNFTAENYHFLNSGHKLAPAVVYETYVQRGAKYELNLDSGLQNRWAKAAESGNWKSAKSLVEETRGAIRGLTVSDTLPKIKAHPVLSRLLRAELGGKKVPALVDKARKACMVYARQTQAYGKRWKGIQPDFCTPLNVALDDILGQMDRIREHYP